MEPSPCCTFRPCIDIKDGRVTQIVGSTLLDGSGSSGPLVNFIADQSSSYYAKLYGKHGLAGGHVIMLGTSKENKEAALEALRAFPMGMQVGGGIDPSNAKEFLDAGASHVIVTSYVFREGKVDMDRLELLRDVVTKKRLVLDLSCRQKEMNGPFYVVTDRWQKFTDLAVSKENLEMLAKFCDEFLVHGVEVEGKKQGIIGELVKCLGEWSTIPVTYAGGVRNIEDCDLVRSLGNNRVNVSIGSALSIFGGGLDFDEVVEWNKKSSMATTTTATTVLRLSETVDDVIASTTTTTTSDGSSSSSVKRTKTE